MRYTVLKGDRYRSLAIDRQEADIIELTDEIFRGPGNRDISYYEKALTIRCQSRNPETCIVDCQGTEASPHRGFKVEMPGGTDMTLNEDPRR